MNLKENFLRLEELIKLNKPTLMDAMNNGLNSHVIANKLQFIDSKISIDIVTLYEWKNGVDGESKNADELFVDGYFLNIDSSIEMYRAEPKGEWSDDFFPLFVGYGGVLTLIGVKKSSINYNKIFFYDPTSGGTNVTHGKCLTEYCDSLESLILSAIECYEQKVYKFDLETSEMTIDWELLQVIYKKNNPNSEYWH